MRVYKLAFTIVATLFLLLPVTPRADWNQGDSHKMHFPQRPDSNGLDVTCRYRLVLADDWNCTSTGAVRDIHFWFSCASDYEPDIELIHVSIHEDIPSSPPEILYSRPGALLWSRNFGPDDVVIREYARGEQGWYNPKTEAYYANDHEVMYQCNIESIADPMIQESGTIYWLDLSIISEHPIGWKTSKDTFNDNAVWGEFAVPGPTCISWDELFYPEGDPRAGQGMDLAFVITDDTWLDNIYDMTNDNEVTFQAGNDILPNSTIHLNVVTPASAHLSKAATSATANIVWSTMDLQIGSVDERGFAPVTVTGGGGQFEPYLWGTVPVGVSNFSIVSGSGRIHWPSGDINLNTVIDVSAGSYADIRAHATGLGVIDYDTDVVTLFAGSLASGADVIPTTTTWGVVVVLVLLLTTGTVLLTRRLRRSPA